jgi:hypothetical protein
MTTNDYVYHEPVQPNFGPLPEGQYSFIVTDIPSEPYTSRNGNVVLPVKLAIGPNKVPLYDNPSAGKTSKGNQYDIIAAFLKCINRNPGDGQTANLSKQNLIGARGELMLKIEIAKEGTLIGKPVNKVDYYIWNKEPGAALVPAKQGHVDPDDIPF